MQLFRDFIGLFYPSCCAGCGISLNRNEKTICIACHSGLPHARIHDEQDNIIEKIFWGRTTIESATAFLRMNRHGLVHGLIHELKYRENKEVGELLGKLFAVELINSTRMNQFDLLIPVPLHPKKQKIRGYNQCEIIATSMEKIMNCPVESGNLFRNVFTSSQTRKSRYDRWENVNEIFQIRKPGRLEGKKILLIDDVITTGATIEACVNTLIKVHDARISVAAIAYPV